MARSLMIIQVHATTHQSCLLVACCGRGSFLEENWDAPLKFVNEAYIGGLICARTTLGIFECFKLTLAFAVTHVCDYGVI